MNNEWIMYRNADTNRRFTISFFSFYYHWFASVGYLNTALQSSKIKPYFYHTAIQIGLNLQKMYAFIYRATTPYS